MLAVILESADPERLYTGLSLLVSAEEARGLATFGALARARRARRRTCAAPT